MYNSERALAGARKRTFNLELLGHPVLSITSTNEPLDVGSLPKYVRTEVKKKAIPEALVADSLAVIGRAYADATLLWSDRIADAPDLPFGVPAPDDFESALRRVHTGVGVGQLVGLATDLFGHTDTPVELINSVKRQMSLLFENLRVES